MLGCSAYYYILEKTKLETSFKFLLLHYLFEEVNHVHKILVRKIYNTMEIESLFSNKKEEKIFICINMLK